MPLEVRPVDGANNDPGVTLQGGDGRAQLVRCVGDELTLLVIRVDPHERRIGLSLKELAHAVAPPPEVEEGRGGAGRKTKRGKSRDYDYDDEE